MKVFTCPSYAVFIFLVIRCFDVSKSLDVYITNASYTWDEAMEQMPCTIIDEEFFSLLRNTSFDAVNILNYTGHVLNNTDHLKSEDFPNDSGPHGWIGAYGIKDYTPTFVGKCVYDNTSLNNTLLSPNDSLRNCFSFCEHFVISITNTSCFCSNITDINSATLCDGKVCDINGQNYKCGTHTMDELQCMCLYVKWSKLSLVWNTHPAGTPRDHCKKLVIYNDMIDFGSIDRVCNRSLPVLCSSLNIEEGQATPTMTSSLSTDVETSTSASSGSSKYISTPKMIIRENSTNIGIYAGIGGGIFVVIIIVIVLIILLRKKVSRNKPPPYENSRITSAEMSTDTRTMKTPTNVLEGRSKLREDKINYQNINAAKSNPIDDKVYNVLHEEVKRPDVACDVYDHVTEVRGNDYLTQEGRNTRNMEPTDYDTMGGAAYNALDTCNQGTIPVVEADYDCMMREGVYNELEKSKTTNIPLELSEYDSMPGREYNTFKKLNPETLPDEFSEYDSMRTING